MKVIFIMRVVQDCVELHFVDLGHRTDIAGNAGIDFHGFSAAQLEQMAHTKRSSRVANAELAIFLYRALVYAKDTEAAYKGIDIDLKSMRENGLVGVRLEMDRLATIVVASEKLRRDSASTCKTRPEAARRLHRSQLK